MIGKILKALMLLILTVIIFSVASIAGVINDDRKAKKLAQEELDKKAEEENTPKAVSSPYEPYTGEGTLDLQMDYEVQPIGENVLVSVVSNLPDGYDITAELSNAEQVKKELGFENISSSALTSEQMNSIFEKTYSQKEKNFVTNGVCEFTFTNPPAGQLDLKITSPITKLQPSSVQELLGEQGANLQGNYVVFLEEVGDKSINFTASFIIEEADSAATEDAAE